MPEQKFEIQEKSCYFCNHTKVILFQEHYIFCPDCTAIYTFMTIQKAFCEHIENAPVIYRHPWFDRDTPKPFIYAALLDDQSPYRCSECDRAVVIEW